MSRKTQRRRIQIIGVERETIDIERFAAAIIGLAQHLCETQLDVPDSVADPKQPRPLKDSP